MDVMRAVGAVVPMLSEPDQARSKVDVVIDMYHAALKQVTQSVLEMKSVPGHDTKTQSSIKDHLVNPLLREQSDTKTLSRRKSGVRKPRLSLKGPTSPLPIPDVAPAPTSAAAKTAAAMATRRRSRATDSASEKPKGLMRRRTSLSTPRGWKSSLVPRNNGNQEASGNVE